MVSGEPKIIHALSCCIKNVVVRYCLTQKLCITDQMKHGVRYLDMRAAYLAPADNFLFIHGVYGHPILDMLKDIQQFLTVNSHEIVILDFNYFYDFTAELHQRFCESIKSIFDGMIYTREHQQEMTSSLQDFWSSKTQILIRYKDDISEQFKEFWPSQIISSPWCNTDSISTLLEKLNEHFKTIEKGKINVFQAILTPTTKTIVCHLCSSLRDTLVVKGNVAIKKWLNDVYIKQTQGINVVICDFICEDSIPSLIINLNRKFLKK